MNPETHLLASWIIGAKTTDNERDCRLVALAGILPGADGLVLSADGVARAFGWKKGFLYLDLQLTITACTPPPFGPTCGATPPVGT